MEQWRLMADLDCAAVIRQIALEHHNLLVVGLAVLPGTGDGIAQRVAADFLDAGFLESVRTG